MTTAKKKKRALPVDDVVLDTAELDYPRADLPDGSDGVAIGRDVLGQAYFVPRSIRNAGPEAQVVAASLQDAVRVIERMREQIGEGVAAGRAEGMSWDALGWCLGITGEAVRVRYGE
jgi:hypothetical protein